MPTQAAKAAAMADAFVAQVNDPSAIFYNLGAMALLEEKPVLTAGLGTYGLNQSLYQGLPPGIGAGTTGEQDQNIGLLPHAYVVKGLEVLGNRIKLGVGAYSPYLWLTQWKSADTFSGSGISLLTDLKVYDIAPAVAIKISDRLGIGGSFVYRIADLQHVRRLQEIDPFTGEPLTFAQREFDSPTQDGFGLNAGAVFRFNDRLSAGFSFRSGIEIDFSGTAIFREIPTGRAPGVIGGDIPFDQQIAATTEIEFPNQTVVGVAFGVTEAIRLEIDLVQTSWSTFEDLDFGYPTQEELDEEYPQDFGNTVTWRIGASFKTRSGSEFRAGVAQDESPQPNMSVGPLLPDADRRIFSFGWGKDWLDTAFQWIDFDQRQILNNRDDFNGNYNGNAWLFVVTVSQ